MDVGLVQVLGESNASGKAPSWTPSRRRPTFPAGRRGFPNRPAAWYATNRVRDRPASLPLTAEVGHVWEEVFLVRTVGRDPVSGLASVLVVHFDWPEP